MYCVRLCSIAAPPLSDLGFDVSRSQSVGSWFFQPKPKSPWTFSLLYCRYIWDRSESVEKNICHQVSKIVILKKQNFSTKTCWLMAFFCQVYRSEFWTPDDRCFFQLNPICLTYTCSIKV